MVSSFSESITLVISPFRLQQWQNDENDKDNGPAAVGRRTLHFTAMYLYNNISSYHTCETLGSICSWSHKQVACSSKNFEEIIFVVEVKSTKTAKFIVLENFPLYSTLQCSYEWKERDVKIDTLVLHRWELRQLEKMNSWWARFTNVTYSYDQLLHSCSIWHIRMQWILQWTTVVVHDVHI